MPPLPSSERSAGSERPASKKPAAPVQASEQSYPRLAVNVLDLDRVDPLLVAKMIVGKVDAHKPVRPDPERPDETGAMFTCNLLTAAMTCDILRSECRRSCDPPVRVYLRRGPDRPWTKVPSDAVLTQVRSGKCMLNPSAFPPEAVAGPMVPPVPKRVF